MSGKPQIPESEWDSICARYQGKEDVLAIATTYGLGREAIYRVLRRKGITLERRGGSPPVPEEVRLEICHLYQAKIGATTISRRFGIDKRSVYNILARAGIGTRPQSDRTGDTYHFSSIQEKWFLRERLGHKRGPSGSFNHDAFSVLDEATCYWAGYLITDGCIGAYDGRSYKLFLPQARKHQEQCEKLRAYLESELTIQRYEKETFGKVRSFSAVAFTLPEEVAQRLLNLGIRPAKTAKASAPPCLLDKPAFWRGVVDGDGSCKRLVIVMNSSSAKLANQFRRFVKSLSIGKEDIHTYQNQAGVWMNQMWGKAGRCVADRLYVGASAACRLERKYEKAIAFAQGIKETTQGIKETTQGKSPGLS